jgi:putative aldouronate transport system permease protein
MVSGDFGYATAVGLFTNVINLILVLSVNWISRKVSNTSLF